MLFVDDADASLVGAAHNRFDVLCRFTLLFQLNVNLLCGLYRSLGVKLGLRSSVI